MMTGILTHITLVEAILEVITEVAVDVGYMIDIESLSNHI